MKQQITWTKNYALFDLVKGNRPFSKGLHKALFESLETHGYDGARPIVCSMVNGRLTIVDGQHRFYWCREHGAAFTYTVSDSATPREFNTQQVPWSIHDWIASHIADGNEAIQELDAFRQKYSLPATICEMLLGGRVSTTSRGLIKTGGVKIIDRKFAHKVAETVQKIAEVFPHARDISCVTALARFCRVPEFNHSRLIEQARNYPAEVLRCATIDGYSKMFDAVYNRNAKATRIPLAFRADEEMRKRNRGVSGTR